MVKIGGCKNYFKTLNNNGIYKLYINDNASAIKYILDRPPLQSIISLQENYKNSNRKSRTIFVVKSTSV